MGKIYYVIITVMFCFMFFLCSSGPINRIEKDNNKIETSSYTYYSEARLQNVKKLIAQNNPYYKEAYEILIDEANKDLSFKANPVTNKNILPPSGNKHDYLSIAPYWWPNPNTSNGLPWVRKDGQVNPQTRGNDTDQLRLSELFNALENLSFAYYFSEDIKYANKAKALIQIWFVDSETRVNPNVNYGQAVPGINDGRPAGIIEWVAISSLVTTLEILYKNNNLDLNFKTAVDSWLAEYVNWLQNSDFGKKDDNGTQNHANWYDYQVVGLLMYLDKDTEAKIHVENTKIKRIALQIEPDGSQPKELARTKSVYYSDMNLRAMSLVADLGNRLGVDLWGFETSDGRSLKKAYAYLRPYAEWKKPWTYEQITPGGVELAIETRLIPLFSIGNTLTNEKLIDDDIDVTKNLNYLQKLQFSRIQDNIQKQH